MVSVTGHLVVFALVVVAVKTGTVNRTKNSSSTDLYSSGNSRHYQGSPFIQQADINTPSPRSIPRGASDQVIISSTSHIEPGNTAQRKKILQAQNASQGGATSGSKIVFPGEQQDSNNVVNFTAKCAGHQSFCENADDYPADYVKKLLENDASLGHGFKDFIKVEVDTRIQPDDEVKLCPSSEQIVFPKVAQNKEDKWLYVVNQDSLSQGVRIEKCEKQEKCLFSENFPSGYVATCQQKYIYRKLLAVGEDGQPVSDSFRLPSCCSCVVSKRFPMARMGNAEKVTPAPSRKRRR